MPGFFAPFLSFGDSVLTKLLYPEKPAGSGANTSGGGTGAKGGFITTSMLVIASALWMVAGVSVVALALTPATAPLAPLTPAEAAAHLPERWCNYEETHYCM